MEKDAHVCPIRYVLLGYRFVLGRGNCFSALPRGEKFAPPSPSARALPRGRPGALRRTFLLRLLSSCALSPLPLEALSGRGNHRRCRRVLLPLALSSPAAARVLRTLEGCRRLWTISPFGGYPGSNDGCTVQTVSGTCTRGLSTTGGRERARRTPSAGSHLCLLPVIRNATAAESSGNQ